MGIEPTYAAWEAAVLPLNYARLFLLYQRLKRNISKPFGSTFRGMEVRLLSAQGGGICRDRFGMSTPARRHDAPPGGSRVGHQLPVRRQRCQPGAGPRFRQEGRAGFSRPFQEPHMSSGQRTLT